MYEKYMIVPEKAKKTEEGFEIAARLPYYRGVSLSMIEEIEVKVDGETLPHNDVMIIVNGKTYNTEQRENELEERWEMVDDAILSVKKEGGFASGEHTVDLKMVLRIGYLPFPATRFAVPKTISL
ncbi:hypothetical protein LV89_03657 [Arcicella aurantiaca]|uniref:C-deglycosylation enzyme beta subunit n=1 Tax=Arcicella aurantiaca TaxID=591202 RepID=A0A316DU83_9BACT|nr:DUF6379 domain-containing protein [Arcicella aurantiaca]PWK21631.1 hypothetical protein LV89_03657 [Arcicella aurantiaca]